VFGVKESLMAEFKRIDNAQKITEHGFNQPYYEVVYDFVLARSR
jgi:catechol 1,2-dioxygenase